MEKFEFSLPTHVVAERGCVQKFASQWAIGSKALIVTGAQSAKVCGALDDVIAGLESVGVPYVLYDGVHANPDDHDIYAGVKLAQDEGCDFIVAIGGGSPMDAGKVIAWVKGAGIAQEEFFKRKPLPTETVLPIVAVPITCGTGSEVTPYAIITDHHAKTKVNVMGEKLFPKFALLDAKYLETLPIGVVCDTAFDALSHAIESVCSPRSTYVSRMLSFEAMACIVPELIRLAHGAFVNLPVLHMASMLAGIAIAQAGTCLVHAMGYPLTYYKGMPHGRANAILLPGYLDFIAEVCPDLVEQMLKKMGLENSAALMGLVDAILDLEHCERISLTEDELGRFALEPLRLTMVKKYRRLPSPEEIIDIYRNGC